MADFGNSFSALAGLTLDDPVGTSSTQTQAHPGSRLKKDHKRGDIASTSTSTQDTPRKAASVTSGVTAVLPDSKAAADTGPDGSGSSSSSPSGATEPKPPRLNLPLVWIDLEMTGLEIEKDTIIEIACLVTDGDLSKVLEGPCITIHHEEAALEGMNEWCKEHHGKSGLTQRARDSTVTLQQAEDAVLAFVTRHTEYGAAQLAGNSVHVDRIFLSKYMPRVVEHLHFRIIDVSTVQELCRRWAPKVYRGAPRKVKAHTALSDIRESLKELKYYQEALFQKRK